MRGVSAEWMEDLYGFALVPDRVIYLDIDVEQLLPRVVASSGFDYWESGMDFLRGGNLYGSYIQYQRLLLEEFRRLAAKHGFTVVDARGSVAEVFRAVRTVVDEVVHDMVSDSGLTVLRHPEDITERGIEAPSG